MLYMCIKSSRWKTVVSNVAYARLEKQEAQLSQRDRATLLTEYFAKSLKVKVIRNDTKHGLCKFLLLFHWNYVCISYRFWDTQRQRMV